MNNSRIPKCILIIIFFVIIAVFPLSWYLMPESVRDKSSENRVLSALSLPESAEELFAFPEALTSWYSDHLPFKEALVRSESELEIMAFDQLDSDYAILGTEKPWLFYKVKDGEQVENYKHTNSFSETFLGEMREELCRLKDKLAENDIDFVLLIAPDKETIYGEYMPSYVKVLKDAPARTDVLLSYLSENAPDIKVVFPKDELLAAKDSTSIDVGKADSTAAETKSDFDAAASAENKSDAEAKLTAKKAPIYYESDTHWNRIGAKVAFDAVMKKLSGDDSEYAKAIIDIGFTDTAYDGIPGFAAGDRMWYEGDIQKLCKLPSAYNSSEFYPERLPYAETKSETVSPGSEVIAQSSVSTSNTYADKKIYFCGDSYRWHLVDYAREGFRESTIISRYYLDLDKVIEEKPDVFVYELPERYLADLHGIPGVSAPAIEITEEYQVK